MKAHREIAVLETSSELRHSQRGVIFGVASNVRMENDAQ
jgi:hypothetical protein